MHDYRGFCLDWRGEAGRAVRCPPPPANRKFQMTHGGVCQWWRLGWPWRRARSDAPYHAVNKFHDGRGLIAGKGDLSPGVKAASCRRASQGRAGYPGAGLAGPVSLPGKPPTG